jgi:spoIIIJ-associated protein
MADNDLDKYLENLGISTDEEQEELEPSHLSTPEPVDNSPVVQFMTDGAMSGRAMTGGVMAGGTAQERLESFLVNLLLNFDPAYAVEVTRADDEEIDVDIFGGDPGKIIGRGGRTLVALEYLANTVINREDEPRIRVSIDVGGYKRRRDDRLRTEARKAAAKVRKSGFAVELEPMSAAERRVIHVELAQDASVMSESTGEGRNRRVVIKPR